MGTASDQFCNGTTSEQGTSTSDTASSTLTTGPINAFASGAMSENVPKAGMVIGSVASCEHGVTESMLAMPVGTPSSIKA